MPNESLIVKLVRSIIETNIGSEDFDKFVAADNRNVAAWHHTVGRSLRNSKSLWGDNDLTAEFKSIGIWHADDMSAVLLHAVHRIMNRRPVNVKSLIEEFNAHWRMMGVDPHTGEVMQNDNSKEQSYEVASHDDNKDRDIRTQPAQPA